MEIVLREPEKVKDSLSWLKVRTFGSLELMK